jgi:hypothetical protein
MWLFTSPAAELVFFQGVEPTNEKAATDFCHVHPSKSPAAATAALLMRLYLRQQSVQTDWVHRLHFSSSPPTLLLLLPVAPLSPPHNIRFDVCNFFLHFPSYCTSPTCRAAPGGERPEEKHQWLEERRSQPSLELRTPPQPHIETVHVWFFFSAADAAGEFNARCWWTDGRIYRSQSTSLKPFRLQWHWKNSRVFRARGSLVLYQEMGWFNILVFWEKTEDFSEKWTGFCDDSVWFDVFLSFVFIFGMDFCT